MASSPTTLLTGKIAIVTGGTRGIGGGVSRELVNRGASVAMVYLNPDKTDAAEKFATELRRLGTGNAVAIRADLGEEDGPATIVQETLKRFNVKNIDIIVNNAALFDATPTPDLTTSIYEKIMNANLRGPIFLVQAVLPYMPRGGRIINMSSFATRHIPIGPGTPPMVLYLAAKSALENLTRTWAVEFGHSRGITANAVSVGFVETDMFAWVPEDVKPVIRENVAKITAAAPRSGTPDDIAQIVAFLASEGSRWVSGSTVSANGATVAI